MFKLDKYAAKNSLVEKGSVAELELIADEEYGGQFPAAEEAETILGLDPGIANFGWAIYYTDASELNHGIIKSDPKLEVHQRILQIITELNSIIGETEISAVAIEGMYLHNVNPGIIKGYAAKMCVLVHLQQRGIQFYEYNPTATKRELLGKGIADKKTMKDAVYHWFDFATWSGPDPKLKEHEVDSFAQIAMYVLENKIDCYLYRHMKEWRKENLFKREKKCKK
jgi:crossover junction endodeoxyribonuclease RuvC